MTQRYLRRLTCGFYAGYLIGPSGPTRVAADALRFDNDYCDSRVEAIPLEEFAEQIARERKGTPAGWSKT